MSVLEAGNPLLEGSGSTELEDSDSTLVDSTDSNSELATTLVAMVFRLLADDSGSDVNNPLLDTVEDSDSEVMTSLTVLRGVSRPGSTVSLLDG